MKLDLILNQPFTGSLCEYIIARQKSILPRQRFFNTVNFYKIFGEY